MVMPAPENNLSGEGDIVKGRTAGWFILRMPPNGRVAEATNTYQCKES
jgi:hypothetical protein